MGRVYARANDDAGARTCMVILSADESPRVVLDLLSAGAMAYVRKGVTSTQIAETLADALRAKEDPPQG